MSTSDFLRRGTRFAGQFALSPHVDPFLRNGRAEPLCGWTLRHCESLPVRRLLDADSTHVGWVVGWPIDVDRLFSSGGLPVPARAVDATFAESLESTLYSLAGRFAAVVLTDSLRRIYLDPCGQLGVVYNRREQVAASSLYLAAREPSVDDELAQALNIPAEDNWYPFGLTPDRSVRRLLPNHYLDLERFDAHRHWTCVRPADADRSVDVSAPIATVAGRLRANIETAARDHPLLLSLTAGRDSRMLLAAARRTLDRIAFFTTQQPDESGHRDCRVARRCARRFRLQHTVLSWRPASDEELEEWQLLTGRCVAGRTWRAVRTRRQGNPARVFMPGLCGEIGRSYYWKDGDLDAAQLSAETLVRRLHLPQVPAILDAAESWLQAIPDMTVPDVLDHAYIEQRLGCWAGPSHYGHTHNACTLPLSDRQIVAAMLRLPPGYRRRRELAADVIRLLWPDLLALPFNQDAAMVRWSLRVMRRLRRGTIA